MAVRQDQVQIKIDFITDESRALSKTILETKKLNDEIAASNAKIKEYDRELKQANITEAKRTELMLKRAAAEQTVSKNLAEIATAGKKVEALDLSKVAPAQLIERAKQLQQAMRLIPQSAPEFRVLQGELAKVNGQLRTINETSKGLSGGAAGGGGLFQRILGVAGGIGVFQLAQQAIGSLINFGRTALQELDAGLKADAQVKAAIESTKSAAGRSFEELKTQAEDLAKVTLFGDDTTKGAQALLLTFKNVKTEIFDQAIPLAQDLSTAFGQDLNASAIQLGKALDDPIRGVTALRRVGVSFTEDQQTLIASLVKTGDVAGAQTIILKELESQVGGSAKAAAEAGLGPFQVLRNRLGEVQESIGGLIANGLQKLAPFLLRVVSFLEQLTERLTTGKSAVGEYSTAVNVVATIFNVVAKVFQLVALALEFQVKMWTTAGQKIGEFIGYVRELPVVGELFETFIITPLRFVGDAIDNLPAAWAGFVAATKQAAINIAADLRGLVLDAKIFVKNMEAALTFSAEGKAKVAGELKGLESQKAVAAQAGKTIGEAYTQARDAVLAKSPGAASPGATAPGGKPPAGDLGGAGPIGDAKKEAEAAEGSVAFLRKQISDLQKEIESTPGSSKALAPLIEQLKVAELALKAIEERIAALKNPQVEAPPSAADIAAQLGDESSTPSTGFSEAQLLQQIELNDAKLAEDEKYFEALGDLRTRDSEANIEKIKQDIEQEKELKKQAQDALLSSAESIAAAFIQIRQSQIQQEADAAISALDKEYEEKRKQAGENKQALAQIDKEYEKKKAQIERDAAEKRKRAAITEAIIAGALAVVKSLPNVFAAIAASVATAAQIAIIANQKFAGGGFTGQGFGSPDSSGHRPAGIVHAGEYVAPAWQVNNPETGPVVAWLNNRRLRGYAAGGFVAPNTTPNSSLPVAASSTTQIQGLEQFTQAVAMFNETARNFPREVKSRVVYTEIEDAGTELNSVRGDAAL
jgi:hypothetical protein